MSEDETGAFDGLKCCIFCGDNESIEIYKSGPRTCWVGCDNCSARGPSSHTEELAKSNWNKPVCEVDRE